MTKKKKKVYVKRLNAYEIDTANSLHAGCLNFYE